MRKTFYFVMLTCIISLSATAQVTELGIGINPPIGMLHLHDAGNTLAPINPNAGENNMQGGNVGGEIETSDGDVIIHLTNLNTGTSLNDGFMLQQYNKNITLKQHEQGYIKIQTPGACLILEANGSIGIGSTYSGYKFNVASGKSRFGGIVDMSASLTVGSSIQVGNGFYCDADGNMMVKHIKVTLDNWPDYVFSNEYKMMPLNEVARCIHDNGFLPGFPSADDVKKNGVNIEEINRLLVEKVEELTLRIIDLQQQIDELKTRQ